MKSLLKCFANINKKRKNKKEVHLAHKLWDKAKGDETHRLNYDDLDENSIVFDLGGYKGDWASDIFSKYGSHIYVFEPAHKFYAKIVDRFKKNPKIKVFDYGLADKNLDLEMAMSNDGSSVYNKKIVSAEHEVVKLVDAAEFLQNQNIENIDLMKINIEGGEYDLLNHLIDIGFIENINNIQVQFHPFVDRAEERMSELEKRLALSHKKTYSYKFVWENWERIK